MLTYNSPETTPILENLSITMRCGLFTNAKGEILLVHYEDLPGDIDYMQYDPASLSFYLIYENGQMQKLGLTMQDRIDSNLVNGTEVTLARIEDKKIVSAQKIIFLIEAS